MNLLLEQNRNVIRSMRHTDIYDDIEEHPLSDAHRKTHARRLMNQLNLNYKRYMFSIDKNGLPNRLPWPTIAFKTAVDYCMSLPIRSDQSLLAACLKQACLEVTEFSPTDDEICELMQISKTQLSDGIRCLDDFIEKGDIHFKNIDIIRCEISTMFARLYLHNEIQLKERVYEFIQKTSCIRSNIRTKVVGATFKVVGHRVVNDTLEKYSR